MSAKNYTVRMPEELMAAVRQFARESELPQSSAIRVLVQRALGGNVAHAIADERVNQANNVIRARFATVFTNLRAELHAALDEAAGGGAPEAEAEPEEAEPEVVPVRGRRPAKARRR